MCVPACSSIFCMWKNVCVCLCMSVCDPPQPSTVFSSSLTVIPLSTICPSLKHQLFSKGPLGEKETTGRLHFFFYPHKDVLLLPVLLFFQEVFAVRLFPFCLSEILFIHVPSLCFSHFLSLSVNWWCWLCFTLPLSKETHIFFHLLSVSALLISDFLFLISFERAEKRSNLCLGDSVCEAASFYMVLWNQLEIEAGFKGPSELLAAGIPQRAQKKISHCLSNWLAGWIYSKAETGYFSSLASAVSFYPCLFVCAVLSRVCSHPDPLMIHHHITT